ncbi:MAG: c-type cytochrome [Anaerolineales bacterium]|nr:c-type cytochrome [Anaerolineales bacterium]
MKTRRIPSFVLLTAIFCAALAAAACSSAEATVDPLEIGDPEIGREVFSDTQRTRCERCHTLDGGTYRPGPTLLGIPSVAGQRVADLSAAEYLRQSILDPQAYIVEGFADVAAIELMPAYTLTEPGENGQMEVGTLTDDELNHLIAFLLTLDQEE